MKIYLAAGFSSKDLISKHKQELVAGGVTVTSTWTEEESAPNSGLDAGKDKTYAMYADRDMHEIDMADTLVLFSVDPTIPTVRGGRHVEFGYAAGKGKNLIVVGPKENIFHYPSTVKVFPSWDEAKTHLLGA